MSRLDPHRLLALALGVALTASLFGAPASADVVHLSGGRQLVGRVVETKDAVRVEMQGGTITLPRASVLRIERRELPAEELGRRRGELAEGDAAAALDLAGFARDAGLEQARGELLRLASDWAPEDEEARAALLEWERFERQLPPGSEAAAELLRDFGKGARLYRTDHWRIAHDVPLDVVRDRGEMLEAAWRKYHQLADKIGLPPRTLDDRLEVFLFADHARWLAAVGLPAEQVARMSGLYVPRTGRVLLFDPLTAPEARKSSAAAQEEVAALTKARAELDDQRRKLSVLDDRLDEGGTLNQEQRERRAEVRAFIAKSRAALDANERTISARETQLAAYLKELRRHYESEALASVTHEACHQLAFATDLGRMGDPLWLTEGLATLFEVTDRSSFVLEAPNVGRLGDLRRAWQSGRGGKLAAVVTDAIYDTGPGVSGLAYAESWALAHFLAVRRTAAFADFVRSARQLPRSKESRAARLEEFRRHFGQDLDGLEREWRRYVERL